MKQNGIGRNSSAQVGIGTLIIFIAMVLVAAVAATVLIQTSGVLQQKAQATGKEATQEVSSNLMISSVEGVRAKNSSTLVSSTIDLLKVQVGLNVASEPVDINQVVISISDGSTANNLIYAGNTKTYASIGSENGEMDDFNSSSSSANLQLLLCNQSTDPTTVNNSAYYFIAEKVRDEDKSFSQSNPVMTTGDYITIYLASTSITAASSNYQYVGSTDTSSGLKDSGLNMVPRTTVSIVLTPESGATTICDFTTPSSYGVKETVKLYP